MRGMTIKMAKCSVLGARVACLAGPAGEIATVTCPEREKATEICRLKATPNRPSIRSEVTPPRRSAQATVRHRPFRFLLRRDGIRVGAVTRA